MMDARNNPKKRNSRATKAIRWGTIIAVALLIIAGATLWHAVATSTDL